MDSEQMLSPVIAVMVEDAAEVDMGRLYHTIGRGGHTFVYVTGFGKSRACVQTMDVVKTLRNKLDRPVIVINAGIADCVNEEQLGRVYYASSIHNNTGCRYTRDTYFPLVPKNVNPCNLFTDDTLKYHIDPEEKSDEDWEQYDALFDMDGYGVGIACRYSGCEMFCIKVAANILNTVGTHDEWLRLCEKHRDVLTDEIIKCVKFIQDEDK